MDKSKYHHGSLKSDLIEKGLVLLNSAGFEAFSIRKVADMCGVSHAAPYRHFKSKEELISAITLSTSEKFITAIETSLTEYSGDYKKQIVEMSKFYVKFMVENPEHFKFIFLINHNSPILFNNNAFIEEGRWPVNTFKRLFTGYLQSIGRDNSNWSAAAMTVWSIVHGLTVMLVNNTISCGSNYLDLVSGILNENLSNMK